MMNQKQKTVCMSCGSKVSEDVVIIGNQLPSAVFKNKNDIFLNALEPTSLNLVRCTNEDCSLIQLANYYDLQYVFDHYPYESGTTATMTSILQDVVNDAFSKTNITNSDVILDIGGNDGTLLNLVKTPVKYKINIDAASGVNQIIEEPNYKYVCSKFDSSIYKNLNIENPKIIFSVAMFYHLSNPIEFCKNVFNIMNDDSLFILQMTYLGNMLEDNIFDNIVHEHAAYYSLKSLEYLLSLVGLKIIDAKIVKSYGGSLRATIVKNTNTSYEKTDNYFKLKEFEETHKINTFETLYAFNSRIQLLKTSLLSIIDYIINKYGTIWGFGASTKGNMLLQLLNIKSDKIPYILDNNTKKIGLLTMGSEIPIISEKENITNSPTNLFILPYYYVNAFIKTIQKNVSHKKKLDLLIPLPYPKFITIEGLL